jgi:hypothetical protein
MVETAIVSICQKRWAQVGFLQSPLSLYIKGLEWHIFLELKVSCTSTQGEEIMVGVVTGPMTRTVFSTC